MRRINISNILKELESIDWSFRDRDKAHPIENIHPYPAKFIGDIPRTLLQVLPVPNDCVLFDPFVGSGTSLIEAQRFGYSSIGIDLNPIACLISRVKTNELPPNLIQVAEDVCDNAIRISKPKKWSIPNLDHWFEEEIQEAISSILQGIAETASSEYSDCLRLALSSILVRVSNQDSDTRYAAVTKDVGAEDVFPSFIGAVKKLHSALQLRTWELTESQVIQGNTLSINPDQLTKQADIVVTSPPYPNAYEYWLYHKYRMWWLGHDPLAVKAQEIGARAHFFKKSPHTEETFWSQMRRAFSLITDVLSEKGFVCFVVGRSKIRGKLVDNASIVKSVAKEHGLREIGRIDREISPNRKSFNLAHANIKTEAVQVFCRKTV